MDPLVEVLQPISEMGANVSASIYKLPASVNNIIVAEIISKEPRLDALMKSGKAKVNGIIDPDGSGMLAIGGFIEPEVFASIHDVLMSIAGVEFVVGCGPGCATLPLTALGAQSAGAHKRAMSARPWWKFWG
jgi:hypothetical protein